MTATEVDLNDPDAVRAAADRAREAATSAAAVVAHFRWLADWFEAHPATAYRARFAVTNPVTIYAHDEDDWRRALAELGRFRKDECGSWLMGTVDSPHTSEAAVAVAINRQGNTTLCERVQVGTRTVEREVVEVVGTEEVEEPIYEWVCPESWLTPPEAKP